MSLEGPHVKACKACCAEQGKLGSSKGCNVFWEPQDEQLEESARRSGAQGNGEHWEPQRQPGAAGCDAQVQPPPPTSM